MVDSKPKYFSIIKKRKQDTVSIDILKPVYMNLPTKNSTTEQALTDRIATCANHFPRVQTTVSRLDK